MDNLRLWANYYYNMGFNVTHINPELNYKAKNPYKSATNSRHEISNIRQSLSKMKNFDWDDSTGIGTVLGFNNLRAIDFDFYEGDEPSKRNEIIDICLHKLRLPLNYEWVMKTPNGGFHILLYCEHHNIPVKNNLTRAFTPNVKYYNYCDSSPYTINYRLKQIELRWSKHLVLPPSTSDLTNERVETARIEKSTKVLGHYKFYTGSIPKFPPHEISLSNLKDLLDEICYDYYSASKSGYNLHLSSYYDENDTESIKFYDTGEFLDLSPVYFKIDGRKEVEHLPQDDIPF